LVAHFFLATIHPFEDGSGRVSRLVSAGILFQRGYNGHGFYALSSHFYENQERYYRIVFKQQQEPCPELTEFIAFGLEGLALELRGISSFIKVKLNRVVYRESLVASRKQRRARRRQAPL
jgi:Fic family protein